MPLAISGATIPAPSGRVKRGQRLGFVLPCLLKLPLATRNTGIRWCGIKASCTCAQAYTFSTLFSASSSRTIIPHYHPIPALQLARHHCTLLHFPKADWGSSFCKTLILRRIDHCSSIPADLLRWLCLGCSLALELGDGHRNCFWDS